MSSRLGICKIVAAPVRGTFHAIRVRPASLCACRSNLVQTIEQAVFQRHGLSTSEQDLRTIREGAPTDFLAVVKAECEVGSTRTLQQKGGLYPLGLSGAPALMPQKACALVREPLHRFRSCQPKPGGLSTSPFGPPLLRQPRMPSRREGPVRKPESGHLLHVLFRLGLAGSQPLIFPIVTPPAAIARPPAASHRPTYGSPPATAA
jgi:hypothetical protein